MQQNKAFNLPVPTNVVVRRALMVVACFVAASGASAVPTDAPATPLVRAEKSLRDLGERAKDTASDITSYALSLIGVDYRFGGSTPDQGLDCSGLIRYVFQQATGLLLPRSAREQARVGESISKDKLQPGDLVFFNTRRFQFSHVGLYIGNGEMLEAPHRGALVRVKSIYRRDLVGAGRVG